MEDNLQKTLQYIESEIIDQYVSDESTRPWIIGFSGGKDSTMLLQMVWYAIKKIPKELLNRRIYIVCNDTLVENPKVVDFIRHTLALIRKAAEDQHLPITVHETVPILNETFWFNVIGKGYLAPTRTFRWCTDRLKIKPTTKFILEKINKEGEAIILLGTRSDESANRARSIKKHTQDGRRLRKHALPNAFVYSPISDLLTEEVWLYLASVPAPWGGNHHRLITLYRNASGGDCPLVIDTSSPSCGKSRFGCWVCTVVKRDKSMEALIDHGEEWMLPLLEIRDFLLETRENGEKYRSKTRRNGSSIEGQYGPYLPETRYEILKRLLIAQREIQQNDKSFELISQQELTAIQVFWIRDNIFDYRVTDLYNEIFHDKINIIRNPQNQELEDSILLESCDNDRSISTLIKNLLELEQSKILLKRKKGIQKDIDARLEQYLKENLITDPQLNPQALFNTNVLQKPEKKELENRCSQCSQCSQLKLQFL